MELGKKHARVYGETGSLSLDQDSIESVIDYSFSGFPKKIDKTLLFDIDGEPIKLLIATERLSYKLNATGTVTISKSVDYYTSHKIEVVNGKDTLVIASDDPVLFTEQKVDKVLSVFQWGEAKKAARFYILMMLTETLTNPVMVANESQMITWYRDSIADYKDYGNLDIITQIEDDMANTPERQTVLLSKPLAEYGNDQQLGDLSLQRFVAYKKAIVEDVFDWVPPSV